MKNEATDSYSHVLKYTGLFGGVQGLNILVGLVRNKLIAEILGPAGMGLASLFNSTVTFISQATNFGISFSAVKHVSELFDSGDEAAVAHFIKVIRAWSLLTALLVTKDERRQGGRERFIGQNCAVADAVRLVYLLLRASTAASAGSCRR